MPKKSIEVLGSVVEIQLPKRYSSFFSSLFSRLRHIETQYSRFLDTSQLSRMNSQLHTWQEVDKELLHLIKRGLTYEDNTSGTFSLFVKEDLDRLGYDQKYSFSITSPARSLKKKLLKLLPPIKQKGKQIYLRQPIDLGGLGKGFAIDEVVKMCEKKGIDHYYINAGGDVYAKKGKKGKTHTIFLEHPDKSDHVIGELTLDKHALACSAANRRKWSGAHHLINPKTGQSENTVKCVFVLAKKAIDADTYATSLFCAGFEKACKLSWRLPIETMIISSTDKMFISPGFPVKVYE